MPVKPFWILGSLLLAGSAAAQQWFAVANLDARADAQVEVDLETVGTRATGDTTIRVTFDVLQPHPAGFGFRSFIATSHFDCQKRIVTLTSAAYFTLPAGGGQRVGTDSSGQEAGMPLDLAQRIPATARQALLRATCAVAN
ncbi:MAG: surface-adhesin E family protein [Pseudomonadota bacterium]